MSNPNLKRPALLIVDMQVGLFHGPQQPHDGEQLLANINQLIDKARQAGVPIFVAQHSGPPGSPIEPGNPLWQLLPELNIAPRLDRLFNKTRPSCFFATGLNAELKAVGVETLLIVGLKTQYCIDSSCRAAADLGFQVVLVADAHSCMDTPAAAAKTIVEHHNQTLSGPFARLMQTAEVQFQRP